MKKKILLLCPKIPEFDLDAWSRRVYRICVTLVKYYDLSLIPVEYFWVEKRYVNSFRDLGVRILFPNYKSCSINKIILENKFDYVLFEYYYSMIYYLKSLNNCLNNQFKIIIDTNEIRSFKTKSIYDLMKDPYNEIKYKVYLYEELSYYSLCDILIVLTRFEQDYLKKFLPRKKIYFIPTPQEGNNKVKYDFFSRKDIVFLGSFINDVNLDAVLHFVRDIFPNVKKKIKGIKFHIAGKNANYLKNIIDDSDVIIDGEIEDINEYLSRFRLFVCPIRYGSGMKSKILDSISSGTPVIVYSDISKFMSLKDGVDVICVNGAKDFIRGVTNVYENKSFLEKISSTSQKILSRYSIKKFEKSLFNVFN